MKERAWVVLIVIVAAASYLLGVQHGRMNNDAVLCGEKDSETVQIRPNARINPNLASIEELDSLPGIGPVLAERIVKYREENGSFEQIEDMLKISGLGPKMIRKIEPYLLVEE